MTDHDRIPPQETLRDLLEFWTHESRLQTFEDRDRFRKAARATLDAIPAASMQSGRIAVGRWWLEQIQEQLFGMENLSPGPVGDWIFLFREQVKDLLQRPDVPSPCRKIND